MLKNIALIPVLWLLIASAMLPGQEPAGAPAKADGKNDLAALATAFKADLDEVAADYEKWFAALQKWYLGGLEKLQGERIKAGDLDGTLACKAERERIAAGAGTTQEEIQAMPESLRKLRVAYEPALKKIMDEAARRKDAARARHIANLEALQKRLTLSQDLDAALLVRKEKERFAAETPPLAGSGAGEPSPLTAQNAAPPSGKSAPFLNSLGMKFVPVPGVNALFSIWDTRVKDYAAFAKGRKIDDLWTKQNRQGVPVSRGPEDPVVGVSWEDAVAFCQWLTKEESDRGMLTKGRKYRLPTDAEWSIAVGLTSEKGETPAEKTGKNNVDFPWGTDFPPRKTNVGNYADSAYHEKFPDAGWLKGYSDGYATTSPVGSFAPNALGLYDMGGNVWQWCDDWFDKDQTQRVQRGGCWSYVYRGSLLLSSRDHRLPNYRDNICGFRCVLADPEP